ncbi:hypothetical protein POM88_032369 [Heracleum sosnowskyi]|uniref:F-box domain-containing protein n=1 Tax=Heracleum sosnowskyi TaxID=360622 RepID=A0AAD8HZH1_9APIA|nr:hypothetical protein POM88_032369 [Heracleum sosnowskyi]
MAHSFPESEDILSNIFKRLPVKSLRQCMPVNKLWYYLIQTPDFITLHFNYQNGSPEDKYLLFRVPSSRDFYSLRYDDEQCQEYYKIEVPDVFSSSWKFYGISHGLICLSCLNLKQDSNIYIWNPAIQKIKKLPASPLHFTSDGTVDLAFGYLAKTNNDFKVVKISIYRIQDVNRVSMGWSTSVDVYSLSSNSWETFRCNFADLSSPYTLYINNSVFVNGSAIWLGKKINEGNIVLIRFNIENEDIEEIKLPTRCRNVFIQAWDELIYLFAVDEYRDILKMWALEGEENVVWEKKKMCISLKGKCVWVPLGFRNNGEMILMRSRESGLASCDVDNESEEYVDLWPPLVTCRKVEAKSRRKAGRIEVHYDLSSTVKRML